jgi:iron complex transport system ATP-binding protein
LPLLSIESLSTGYEKDPVISEISLEIPRSSLFGIIGPNGAGKTTLFRAMGKILHPWGGRILYDGEDIKNLSRREFAQKISVIPQFHTTIPPFTVKEFVCLGRYPHLNRFSTLKAADYMIVEEILSLLDISQYRDKMITSLSGGEMQRAFVAQGLVQKPALILMDEPTSHLDITHQIKILDLVKALSENSGLTVVIILHDLNLASAYCNFIALMKEGTIFANGTPTQVLTRENIEDVYKTRVHIRQDPLSCTPHIFFIPGQFYGNKNTGPTS